MKLAVDERTQLRPFVAADAPPLFALVDANRAHLRAWLPWLDFVREVGNIREFIAGVTERAAAGTSLELAIVHQNELCGVAGYRSLDRVNREGEVGYWLRADRQGRGIMSGSVRALVRHGFESLSLNRIVLRAATGNAPSRAVAERLGFQLEGIARDGEWLYDHFVDLAVYALLRRDMRA